MEHRGCDASDLAAAAREIVESNLYVTLATANAEGRPRASPVWFAHEGYRDFLWVSRPEARHSRNLAARPELALVIFDSTAAEGDAAVV
jgi:nitroimidazol reductase NimA-like FMN-containing flavoprotein (pyridoxamine 5'-phosphate oxidase superfamily)